MATGKDCMKLVGWGQNGWIRDIEGGGWRRCQPKYDWGLQVEKVRGSAQKYHQSPLSSDLGLAKPLGSSQQNWSLEKIIEGASIYIHTPLLFDSQLFSLSLQLEATRSMVLASPGST
jgi:hypothetical protein